MITSVWDIIIIVYLYNDNPYNGKNNDYNMSRNRRGRTIIILVIILSIISLVTISNHEEGETDAK